MTSTTNLIKKFPYPSLIIVALLCGLLWRLEVEYHGWKGLIWISYFHWALPASFILFFAWAIQFLDIPFLKKLILCVLATVYACVLYLLVESTLYRLLLRGPQAMILLATENTQWMDQRYGWLLLASLVPISIGIVVRIFEMKMPSKYIILSIAGIFCSIPLAIGMLMLVQHKGSHDVIHTLKSGFLIPFWVFSVGILFVGQRKPDNTKSID